MGLPFITENPSDADVELFSLMLSTYLDGTGNQRDKDGGTRPSWREIERAVAEFTGAVGGEDKSIFDVVARDWWPERASIHYGISVKSKEYSRRNLDNLDDSGRVYMEVANSPAKFWAAIQDTLGLTEDCFRTRSQPEAVGSCVLALVEAWHALGKRTFDERNSPDILNLENSCYLSVTYSRSDSHLDREYQVHAFPLRFPMVARWEYRSDKCLRGYDPQFPDEPLFDWYGLSGGQLKYYPRASSAKFRSRPFKLTKPGKSPTIKDKVQIYFPDAYTRLIGSVDGRGQA